MESHADTHDLDKLRRWKKDLEAAPSHAPGVFAIFLVSGEDRAAHNVFRTFRTSFEERELSFAHLVIFGQHGVSTSVRALQQELGLDETPLPTLVLFGGDTEDGEYFTADVVSLPRGGAESIPLQEAYWWTDLYWSDAVMSGQGSGSVSMKSNVLAALTGDSPGDAAESAALNLAEVLLWAEDKIEDSKEAGGPPELNRVLKKRLADLCAVVVEGVEIC